ncbi:MAG: hypothetical protein R3315_02385, partial [Woeseiaceae bacterium]|nr:hypothetical protein [Woeseiaceae bacterium]
MDKRQFLRLAAAASAATALAPHARAEDGDTDLPDLAANATPISRDERERRIARAQVLMGSNDIDAIVI